ncbi:DUF5677 domain-containing protein [Paenibacillus sanguinis]|uniref:DUF5677 domain-containing protein n=1 Tax=Paenibacillus sanguinis TaxID=225906 RepID=UPI000367FFBE|nr:DUF5677 domain-containing protein [Paenibacillus sanguinis]
MVEELFSRTYVLTNEDREMIQEHMMFYDDFERFGNNILDAAFVDETIEDYELTIYSKFYRILELLDTLKVMTKESLINSGFYVLRVLLESAVQLRYMIDSKEQMRERATVFQMFDIKRTAANEELFFNSISEIECYKNYIDLLKAGKRYENWFSYCERKKVTIQQLFELVGWSTLYTDLYVPLSREIHGVTHMESNITYQRGKFYFKAFRNFENHVSLLVNTLSIVTGVYSCFFKVYNLEAHKKEWDEYESKALEYIASNKEIVSQFGYSGRHFF